VQAHGGYSWTHPFLGEQTPIFFQISELSPVFGVGYLPNSVEILKCPHASDQMWSLIRSFICSYNQTYTRHQMFAEKIWHHFEEKENEND
jgi:hypothetical protein